MPEFQFDAEPYPLAFDPGATTLLIIDMQRDFLEPGGFGEILGNDVSRLRGTIAPCRRVLEAARAAGLMVIHTREGHRPDLADAPPSKLRRGRLEVGIGDAGPMGRVLVRGEHGHGIVDELSPAPGEVVLDKPGKGAFYQTDLELILANRRIRTLIVCGVTTEVCVHSTVREANDRGYECLVLSDGVGSYFAEFQRVGLAMIKAQGAIFGWVSESAKAVAALERCSGRGSGSVPPERNANRREFQRNRIENDFPGGKTMTDQKVSWWVPGDWNGFFGLGTNVLLNLLVLTGILHAIGMPSEIVFGRILPAVGLMLFLGNMYYAWMAKRLADREGRADVAALPSGPSVPHMFFVVFVIMLPIKLQTNDPILAWHAGLAWVFIEGVVLFLGAFIAPTIRRLTPRAALLGTLAGISITFISMRPAFQMLDSAVIGLICFAIILGAWYGGVRYPGRVPGGLVAIAVGTALAWISYVFGWGLSDLSPAGVEQAVGSVGFSVPVLAVGQVFSGLGQFWAVILVTAVPFGIYDFVEAMDNVESAAAAGDEYSTREAIGAEGVISLIGTLLGSPFANAVYIGHPGWKAIGGRVGYSIGTGVMVLVLTWLGIVKLLLTLIPLVAILPILLYIGVLIGAQAFQATPRGHAPAVVLALVPNLALWLKTRVDGALQAAGWNPAELSADQIAALGNNGVLYRGLEVLSGGAIVTGLLWGALAAFMLDRRHEAAAVVALIAAALALFGFIHGPAVGWWVSPVVALAYLIVAGILYGFTRMEADPVAAEEVTRPDVASA